jgi:hypothetical protein
MPSEEISYGKVLIPIQKNLHIANWDLISWPKSEGGLGIINLEMMNIALTGK